MSNNAVQLHLTLESSHYRCVPLRVPLEQKQWTKTSFLRARRFHEYSYITEDTINSFARSSAQTFSLNVCSSIEFVRTMLCTTFQFIQNNWRFPGNLHKAMKWICFKSMDLLQFQFQTLLYSIQRCPLQCLAKAFLELFYILVTLKPQTKLYFTLIFFYTKDQHKLVTITKYKENLYYYYLLLLFYK